MVRVLLPLSTPRGIGFYQATETYRTKDFRLRNAGRAMTSLHTVHESYTLRFLFLGVKRHWKAIKGYAPSPPQGNWEVRSVPTGLTAWGASLDEAIERLQRTIDAAAAHAEDAGVEEVAWYREQFETMSERDKRLFTSGWGRIAAKAEATYKINRSKTEREYGILDTELAESGGST